MKFNYFFCFLGTGSEVSRDRLRDEERWRSCPCCYGGGGQMGEGVYQGSEFESNRRGQHRHFGEQQRGERW